MFERNADKGVGYWVWSVGLDMAFFFFNHLPIKLMLLLTHDLCMVDIKKKTCICYPGPRLDPAQTLGRSADWLAPLGLSEVLCNEWGKPMPYITQRFSAHTSVHSTLARIYEYFLQPECGHRQEPNSLSNAYILGPL